MKRTCLLLVCWASMTTLDAQQVDTLDAYQNLQLGNRQYREVRNFDSAYYYYNKAQQLFSDANFDERAAYCLVRQGLSAYRNHDLDLALSIFKTALSTYLSIYPEDHLNLADPYARLATVYSAQGNYYQALINFKKVLALRLKFQEPDAIEIGVAQYNLGTGYMYYGEYDNGMQAYQQAMHIYLKHYGESHRRLSSLYVNMGILYDKRGEPEKALEYYERSNKIDRELYGDQYALLAYNYYNMAIAYVNLNRHQQALQFYEQTIDLSTKNNIYQLLASAHYGLGNLAKHEKDLDGAERLYLQALELFKEYFGPDHPGMNHSLRALAEVWEQRGGYDRAREYLQQSLSLLQRNYGERHPFIARTLEQEAKLWSLQKQFDQALSTIDRSFVALMKRQSSELDSNSQFADQHIYLGLLRSRAFILQEKYQHQGNIDDLKSALEAFEQASNILDQVRRGYMLDDSKLFLQEEAFSTFEQAISCAFTLYNATEDPVYLQVVHKFIEKSKATVLAEALQGNKLVKVQGVPDSLLKQEVDLKYQISYVESNLAAVEENNDSLQNLLFELKRTYDDLGQTLAQQHPKYYDLKYQVAVATPDEVREQLDDQTAVLNYFIGDENWYVFAISKNNINLHQVDSGLFNDSTLSQFRELLLSESAQEFKSSKLPTSLYQQLVALPLSNHQNITKLVIVPHGQLNHIPFDALLTGDPALEQPLPYLVYKYAVSYTPSMTLKGEAWLQQDFDQRYFGFAPDYTGKELPQLKGSLDEVNYAQKLFDGKLFLNQQATETAFKNNSSASKILHLAMHALVDDQDPMNSRLVFTAADSTDTDDGRLYAHEIYNLNLPSELAVLSACNTGFGEIARGEGIMNLSRAFQYAGSPNIVMSLWQAKDQPTAAIIEAFFRHIKAGLPKDQALQQAKIEYLQKADPFQAHPSQWATFVFVGDTTPMSFRSYWWRWLGLGSLFLVLLVYFIRRSRK